MALIDVNWNPPRRQLRQFAVLFLIFIGGLGTILYFRDKPLIVSEILWNLAWIVGLAGLIFPPLVRPVYVVMMAVALSWIVVSGSVTTSFCGVTCIRTTRPSLPGAGCPARIHSTRIRYSGLSILKRCPPSCGTSAKGLSKIKLSDGAFRLMRRPPS